MKFWTTKKDRQIAALNARIELMGRAHGEAQTEKDKEISDFVGQLREMTGDRDKYQMYFNRAAAQRDELQIDNEAMIMARIAEARAARGE